MSDSEKQLASELLKQKQPYDRMCHVALTASDYSAMMKACKKAKVTQSHFVRVAINEFVRRLAEEE